MTWQLEGCNRGGSGAVSRRGGGGGMPWESTAELTRSWLLTKSIS